MRGEALLLGSVTLGDAPPSVLRGERLTLSLRAPGRRSVQLAERVTGSSWRTREVVLVGDSAAIRLGPLDADVTLFATRRPQHERYGDGARGGSPVRRRCHRAREFPAYLGRRTETLPLGELVRVPRGTALAIEGHSSTELQQVELTRETTVIPLTVAGRNFAGQLVATVSGQYVWSAIGAQGAIKDLPAPLELDVLPDSAPHIEIISPSSDSLISAIDTIAVSVLATDDHGLAGVMLRVVVTNARGESGPTTSRPMSGPGTAQFAGERRGVDIVADGRATRCGSWRPPPMRRHGGRRDEQASSCSVSPRCREQRDAARARRPIPPSTRPRLRPTRRSSSTSARDAARAAARARRRERRAADSAHESTRPRSRPSSSPRSSASSPTGCSRCSRRPASWRSS